MATFSGTVPTTNAFNVARIADTNPVPVKARRNPSQSLLPPLKNTTQRNEKTNANDELPLLQSNTHIMLNLSNLFLSTTMNPSLSTKPKKNMRQSFLTANSIMKSPPWTSMRFPTPQRPFTTYFIKSALDIPIAPKLTTRCCPKPIMNDPPSPYHKSNHSLEQYYSDDNYCNDFDWYQEENCTFTSNYVFSFSFGYDTI